MFSPGGWSTRAPEPTRAHAASPRRQPLGGVGDEAPELDRRRGPRSRGRRTASGARAWISGGPVGEGMRGEADAAARRDRSAYLARVEARRGRSARPTRRRGSGCRPAARPPAPTSTSTSPCQPSLPSLRASSVSWSVSSTTSTAASPRPRAISRMVPVPSEYVEWRWTTQVRSCRGGARATVAGNFRPRHGGDREPGDPRASGRSMSSTRRTPSGRAASGSRRSATAADEFRRRFKAQGEVTGVRTVDLVTRRLPDELRLRRRRKGLNPYINITNRLVVVQFNDFEGTLGRSSGSRPFPRARSRRPSTPS